MKIETKNVKGFAIGRNAGNALSRIISEKIKQHEETKRHLIIAVVTLFIFSCISILFAPPNKEIIGYALGITLVILALGALGAIGASKFILKIPIGSIEAQTLNVLVDQTRQKVRDYKININKQTKESSSNLF